MAEPLNDFDRLQIEMAARGCVSGRLEEWPALHKAFQKLGMNISAKMNGIELQKLCKRIVGEPQT